MWENPCGIFCSPKQCCGRQARSAGKMMPDPSKTAQKKKKKIKKRRKEGAGSELPEHIVELGWGRGGETKNQGSSYKNRLGGRRRWRPRTIVSVPPAGACWGTGGDRGNLGTGAGASTLIPPPAASPHCQVHFQPRWPVIQRLNITNEALNGTRGLS